MKGSKTTRYNGSMKTPMAKPATAKKPKPVKKGK